MSEPVRDRFGRGFSGLRVSVTQRCNLECPHCHREGQRRSSSEMRPGEIAKIVSVAASMGVTKVKITGGEPLIRSDICDIIARIRPHVKEISMTTNGILLAQFSSDLVDAGLDRVNISIHSLSRDVLRKITGKDCLNQIRRGFASASSVGLGPVKLNMVVLRNINDCEISGMIDFVSGNNAILQLIELASDRSGCNEDYFKRHYYPLANLEDDFAKRAIEITHNELHRRARFTLKENGGVVRIEVVRSMHNSLFCENCTRLRLTSDGKLKGCLYDNGNSPDILSAIREGADEEELKRLFMECISNRFPYWNRKDSELVVK